MLNENFVLQHCIFQPNAAQRLRRSRLSIHQFVCWACFALVAALVTNTDAQEAFSFKDQDVVAVIGNGLADRMQHSPWVEAVLQNELKTKQLRFRNMSLSGDVVKARPRSKGFTEDIAYLNHVAPDVVFVFYGYNESFGGADKAGRYTAELVELVQRYRAEREKANDIPRFVLFSPIAFENTGDPNLPAGTQTNKNLEAYAAATRQAAQQLNCSFVDLYAPTQALFESSSAR